MKRTFLAGVLAISALVGASMVALFFLTSAPTSPAQPGATAAEAPPQERAVAPQPLSQAALLAMVQAAETPRTRGTAASPSSTLPDADRVTRKTVRKAIGVPRVQSALARCVDPSGGFGDARSGDRVPRPRHATLRLELELGAAEVRIADLQVQDFGGASEASVSCARSVLVGHAFPAPSRRRPPRAERVSMPFSLNPRSDVVASSR